MRALLGLAFAVLLAGCAGNGGEERWIQVPEGQNFQVRILEDLDTSKAKAGDKFEAVLFEPLVGQGKTAVPEGTKVTGRITNVQKAEAAGQTAYLTFELDSLELDGKRYPIKANYFTGSGTPLKVDPSQMPGKNEIGADAKGAAMNALVPRGSVFRFALAEPLRVREGERSQQSPQRDASS